MGKEFRAIILQTIFFLSCEFQGGEIKARIIFFNKWCSRVGRSCRITDVTTNALTFFSLLVVHSCRTINFPPLFSSFQQSDSAKNKKEGRESGRGGRTFLAVSCRQLSWRQEYSFSLSLSLSLSLAFFFLEFIHFHYHSLTIDTEKLANQFSLMH